MPALPVVLVLVVLAPDVPAALGRVDALVLLAAPAEAPALLAALTALADGLEVVVVVVVEAVPVSAAPRMSMKTTISPLLAVLRNVPAMIGILLDVAPVAEDVLVVDDEPEAPAPPVDVNEPVHWFCVSICW